MTSLRLVCASANAHKVREIAELLVGVAIMDARPLGIPDVIEDAETLLGNARLKAQAVVQAPENIHRLPAVADDTGLFVVALPSQLGVRTARYAQGDEGHNMDPDGANRSKLLRALHELGCEQIENRRAYFVTVALVIFPDGTDIFAEGRCDGDIALGERGDRGFGFDPLFVPSDKDGSFGSRTFAEMNDEEKNLVSHRGRAFAELARQLRDVSTDGSY